MQRPQHHGIVVVGGAVANAAEAPMPRIDMRAQRIFHRIEALSKIGDTMRVLDMKSTAVRDAVLYRSQNAAELGIS